MLSDKKRAQLREGRQFEESGWTDDTREDSKAAVGDGILILDSKWGDKFWFGVVHKIDKTWKYVCLTGLCGCTGHVLQPNEVNEIGGGKKIGFIVPHVRDMSEMTQQRLFLDFQEAMSGESTKVLDFADYPIDEDIRRARIDAEKSKRKPRTKKTV